MINHYLLNLKGGLLMFGEGDFLSTPSKVPFLSNPMNRFGLFELIIVVLLFSLIQNITAACKCGNSYYQTTSCKSCAITFGVSSCYWCGTNYYDNCASCAAGDK